jgi:hypothetical protein
MAVSNDDGNPRHNTRRFQAHGANRRVTLTPTAPNFSVRRLSILYRQREMQSFATIRLSEPHLRPEPTADHRPAECAPDSRLYVDEELRTWRQMNGETETLEVLQA